MVFALSSMCVVLLAAAVRKPEPVGVDILDILS